MVARRSILQVSAGCIDLLELRYQKPPYSQFVICHDDASEETKTAAISALYDQPQPLGTLVDLLGPTSSYEEYRIETPDSSDELLRV